MISSRKLPLCASTVSVWLEHPLLHTSIWKKCCLYFSPLPQVRDLAVVFVSFYNAWPLIKHLLNLERRMGNESGKVGWSQIADFDEWEAQEFWLTFFPVGNKKLLDLIFYKIKSGSTGE